MSHVRRLAWTLMTAYLMTVAWIVFWPSADPATASVDWMADVLRSVGAPGWMSDAIVEFLANIALFLPLSFLGSFLLIGWTWPRWLLTGLCVSVLIELGQFAFLSDRSATAVDVVANTIGALLGATLALPLRNRLLADPGPESSPMLPRENS